MALEVDGVKSRDDWDTKDCVRATYGELTSIITVSGNKVLYTIYVWLFLQDKIFAGLTIFAG